MEIKNISRTYKRTVTVRMPTGGDAWIAHEATVGAELAPEDMQNLPECFRQLEEVAVSEVAKSVNKEIAAIEARRSELAESDEPFPGQTSQMKPL